MLQGDREERRCGATGRQRGREVWCYRVTERKGGVVLQGDREERRCGLSAYTVIVVYRACLSH